MAQSVKDTTMNAQGSGFDRVWNELRAIIGPGITVQTLSRRQPNRFEWSGDVIRVVTQKGADVLGPDIVAPAWVALKEKHIIREGDLPGDTPHRSAAIFALLSLLADVDYTVYPRVSLFLVDHEFTNDQISQTFKVGAMRGYAGTAENPVLTVFITGTGDSAEADHPYQDRWEGHTFLYTGEGLEGDHTLTAGNLALKRNRERELTPLRLPKTRARPLPVLRPIPGRRGPGGRATG